MEKPLTSTNLVEVDLQDELLISNNSEDVGSQQIIATKQTDRKRLRKKLYGIHVDPNCLCQLCEKVFLSPADLEMHRERIHVKKDKLSECQKELLDDKIINKSDYSYYCYLCSFNSDVFSHCKDHLKSHSLGYQGNLKVITISKDALYIYQYSYRRFRCKLCKYKCCNQPAIIKHIKTSHLDIKQEHCKTSSETFDNLATLDSHKCTHTGENPYKCTKQDSPLSNDFNSTNLSEVIKQEEYLILDDPEIEIKESSSLVGLSNENNLKTEWKTKQTKRKSVEITNEANYVILNKIYRCTLCPFGTKDISNIKSHFKAHNILTVSEAPYTVAGKEMYTNLKDYLYEFCDTFYRCKVCAFNCLDYELIKQHVDDFHINVISRCEVCNTFFESSTVLTLAHGDLIRSQYKCVKCEYTSFEPLTEHMESHPNMCSKCEVTSRCAICNTLFESSTVLTLAQGDLIKSQYKCVKCEYTSFEPLTNHMESHPNMCLKCEVTSRCTVCNTLFESSTVLTLHHRDRIRKQYKCLTCEYTSFEPLTNHMESHPNKCSKCDVTSSKLPAKQKQNCMTYVIYCNLCSFKCEITSWHHHVKCHPEKKPRPISIAKNAQYVYEYVEKRFQCNLCEFNHFNHPKMKKHVKNVHVTIGDHQCKFCGKRFETSVILLTHLRTHW